MRMYACVYMHACLYTCMYTYIPWGSCESTTYLYTHTATQTHTHRGVHTHANIHALGKLWEFTILYTYTQPHTKKHRYAYTYTGMHKYMPWVSCESTPYQQFALQICASLHAQTQCMQEPAMYVYVYLKTYMCLYI
jgi:hypothetical protein